MRIALIQLGIRYGEPNVNFERAKKMVKQAAADGATVVVLPELWNTGFDLKRLEEIADVDGEKTKNWLAELSEELGINIVGGSVATKKSDGFYNTMYVTNKEGEVISEYDKVHLFSMVNEHHYLQQGNKKNVFTIEGVPMGGVICYDIRFPEWLRMHVLDGAKVLFIPAQWPAQRIDHWKLLLQARAIENQCFIIAVNSVSNHLKNTFTGQSMAIAPWGEILWTGNDEEEIGIVDIRLEEVEEVRNRIPVHQDRREELYFKKSPKECE